jgi:hypothetical protein
LDSGGLAKSASGTIDKIPITITGPSVRQLYVFALIKTMDLQYSGLKGFV